MPIVQTLVLSLNTMQACAFFNSNTLAGVAVPIPTKPALVIRILSANGFVVPLI